MFLLVFMLHLISSLQLTLVSVDFFLLLIELEEEPVIIDTLIGYNILC